MLLVLNGYLKLIILYLHLIELLADQVHVLA
jgi:hypothetical protein